MKILNATRFTLTLLGLAVAGSMAAQQSPTDFPAERTAPATCDDFRWNADMTREHPRVVDACQEAVDAEGTIWARLSARFVKVDSDGMVIFTIRDKRDRVIEEVMLEPAPGQVAYINDRATEFAKLTATDSINLYVPEGEYGYATQPAPKQRFTRLAPMTSSPPANEDEPIEEPATQYVASADDRPLPSRLPGTAGLLPWAAFGGGILLFAALTVSLRRKL